eukprot:2927357-Amphidinium_carterae.1
MLLNDWVAVCSPHKAQPLMVDSLASLQGVLWELSCAGLCVPALANSIALWIVDKASLDKSGLIDVPAWVIARSLAALCITAELSNEVKVVLPFLARAALHRMVELWPEERALVVWALAMQQCYEVTECFDAILKQTPWQAWISNISTIDKEKIPDAKVIALAQVYLADLALRHEAPPCKGSAPTAADLTSFPAEDSFASGAQKEEPLGLRFEARKIGFNALVQAQRKHKNLLFAGMEQMNTVQGIPDKTTLLLRIVTVLKMLGLSASVNQWTKEGIGLDVRLDGPDGLDAVSYTHLTLPTILLV